LCPEYTLQIKSINPIDQIFSFNSTIQIIEDTKFENGLIVDKVTNNKLLGLIPKGNNKIYFISKHFAIVTNHNSFELQIHTNTNNTNYNKIIFNNIKYDLSDMILTKFIFKRNKNNLVSTGSMPIYNNNVSYLNYMYYNNTYYNNTYYNKENNKYYNKDYNKDNKDNNVLLYNNFFSIFNINDNIIYNNIFYNYNVDTLINKVSLKEYKGTIIKLLKNIYGNNLYFENIDKVNITEYDYNYSKKLKYIDNINIINFDNFNEKIIYNKLNEYTKILFNNNEYFIENYSNLPIKKIINPFNYLIDNF
jgi:hypothetical protein